MQRRSFLRNSILTVGALTLAQQKLLAAFVDDPWKVKMVRGDVGLFTERGGTIGFHLNSDGIVVVDSQFPDQSNHLIVELKKRSDKAIRYLINTHHHGDHSSGNISFKGLAQNVVGHENCKLNMQSVAQKSKTEEKQLYPDITFTNDWKADLNKESIKLQYFGPGHTNGDSIIFFEKANVAHMGDLVFNRRHPFIDRSAGANIESWTKVLNKAADRYEKDTIYIFGHAADGYEVTGTREDLLKFREYLERLLEFARKEFKAGKSNQDFLNNKEIPGVTEWKGDGIQRPLAAAWEEVTPQH
jgi:cyclase